MATEVAVEKETPVSLSVCELLRDVYNILKKEAKSEIELVEPILSEIVNDDDGHRLKKGYMRYDSFFFLRIGSKDKEWVIGFGEACGNYPARPYSCDITALAFRPGRKGKERLEREILEMFRKQAVSYFSQSLMYGMADGTLNISKRSGFCTRMEQACKEFIGRIDTSFVAQGIKTKPGVLTLDLQPVVTQCMEYNPEFVGKLANILKEVLSVS